MFRRLGRGSRYLMVLAVAWLRPARRKLLRRMITFSRALPQQFNQPLPEMMTRLTPAQAGDSAVANDFDLVSPDLTRSLADAVAAWHFRSPLGICLRRSLLRYHFLRAVAVPVQIVFGARLKSSQEGGSLGGHAWLTLNGAPYYEDPANVEGFAEMYRYPQT